MSLFKIEKIGAREIVLEKMQELAAMALKSTELNEKAQAIVLLTHKGNAYCYVINDALSKDKAEEDGLLQILTESADTEIKYILCLWLNGGLDLPSYDLRKKLCKINDRNLHAGIFVNTFEDVVIRELKDTVKM